jgi:transketolase
MRVTFSKLLTSAAMADERVLVLTGDHGYALFDEFRRFAPDRFINCGVAEQNMVGVAAGLAKAGFLPIVYGLSAFVPMRVLEQIKIDICYEKLPVILVGDGAGVVYSHLGASHQCAEDIAALRGIPHLDVFSPADSFELEYVFDHMVVSGRSSYLRFGKADCGEVHITAPEAPIGDMLKMRSGGKDFAFVATGSMVSTAVKLADELTDVTVWSVPSISPLNSAQVVRELAQFRKIFTLEEHAAQAGMGSRIAEVLSENGIANVIRFGMGERFSELCGTYAYLMDYHGLSLARVRERVLASV